MELIWTGIHYQSCAKPETEPEIKPKKTQAAKLENKLETKPKTEPGQVRSDKLKFFSIITLKLVLC